MKKRFLALACATLLATPALAFDAPKLPGAYSVGGNGGAALVLGSATGGATLDVTVKNLTGGLGGSALSAGLGGDQVVLGQGGDGGVAGIEMSAKDTAKIKLDAGQIKGGDAGDAVALYVANLELKIPGVLALKIK